MIWAPRQPVVHTGPGNLPGGSDLLRASRGSSHRKREPVRHLAGEERLHQGAGEAWRPVDRFFGAVSEALRTVRARVAANALALARHGTCQGPFYLMGQVGEKPFSLHAEGKLVILTGEPGRGRYERSRYSG